MEVWSIGCMNGKTTVLLVSSGNSARVPDNQPVGSQGKVELQEIQSSSSTRLDGGPSK